MSDIYIDRSVEVIERAKQDIIKNTDISTSLEEMKVLDNILHRCWKMGWLRKYAGMIKDEERAERLHQIAVILREGEIISPK